MKETIEAWSKAKALLDTAKSLEMDLRVQICDQVLGDKLKGSKTGKFGPYKVTATAKLNSKIDKEGLKSIWKDLSAESKSAIRFNPSLIEANYKKLEKNDKIQQVITHKPGAPSLALKDTDA